MFGKAASKMNCITHSAEFTDMGKAFQRKGAKMQRRKDGKKLFAPSHCYIERLRIFGKIFPSLFSPFAPVQFRFFIDTSALRLSKGFYLPEKWSHKNIFDSIFLTSLRPFPSSVGPLPFTSVAAGRAGPLPLCVNHRRQKRRAGAVRDGAGNPASGFTANGGQGCDCGGSEGEEMNPAQRTLTWIFAAAIAVSISYAPWERSLT
jgi:hypothetical protein